MNFKSYGNTEKRLRKGSFMIKICYLHNRRCGQEQATSETLRLHDCSSKFAWTDETKGINRYVLFQIRTRVKFDA